VKTTCFLASIACGCLCSGLFAQTGEIVFTRATRETGLAATRIHSLIKDHQGYYWMASVNGLQRFDGNRMVNFNHQPGDSTSLPDNNVMFLMEDKQRRLWISAGGLPCIYDPLRRNFRKIPIETNEKKNIAHSFFQDSRGNIWMLAGTLGLFVLDYRNVFRPYTIAWPSLFSTVYSMVEESATGRYWLSTDKGTLLYDPANKTYYHAGNNPQQLSCFRNDLFALHQGILYLDRNNILWSMGWVKGRGFTQFRYDIAKDELRMIDNNSQLWGLLTDQAGNTWAYGTILGRYNYATNSITTIPKKRNSLYGIDFNNIYNMYEDADGNLWALSDIGLYNFNLQKQYFSTVNGVWSYRLQQQVDANCNEFLETSDGHIIGTGWNSDGLVFFDAELKQVPPLYGYNFAHLLKDPNYQLTWCGMQDSEGLIWIGCQHGRILRLDPATKKITTLHPDELENNTIRTIVEDKNGNIWFGSQKSVVVKWERATGIFHQILSEKKVQTPIEWILSIMPGDYNDVWIGSSASGLLHINATSGKVIDQFQYNTGNPESISNNFISAIVSLNRDTLAIATGGGIDLFHPGKKTFAHITRSDGLPAGGIVALVTDHKNNLWLTSPDGISKIHLPDKRVHEYGSLDGITENDFQLRSAIRLKDGRMVFGNTRGFVHVDPSTLRETTPPSDVMISGFRIFDKTHSVDSLLQGDKNIRLRHDQNYITIEFASLRNFMYNRPVYQYKLEGINKSWVTTQHPEAIYSYLPAGTYTFHVKCTSGDGLSSTNVTSFIIQIAPVFYKTWWFFTLLVGVVLAVLYVFNRQRINRLIAVERIRTKVARDLHDDMGSTLSTINILSSMAKTKMTDDPHRTSEYISKITDNSQRMMEAMDDIVWSIKPMNDSIQKITARMREFATGILEAKDIEVNFKVDDDVNKIKLDMEARRDLFLIFKEAINNVAKYSHGSKCLIHIALCQQRLLLDVEDNGVGFDISQADSGNGLSNMHKRAEALKARVSIKSRPGEGTQVTLNMPIR
jgi:ligand-binding sensor domain-containing protein/two-component sensor histidine kinase